MENTEMEETDTSSPTLETSGCFRSGWILLAILCLGAFLRLRYLLASDFPLNDGGMFYTMTLDLIKNDFRLPVFTTYNLSAIPYAYPPLSFYDAAALNQLLHLHLTTIFRFYPLVFNLLSIPAFYLLALEFNNFNAQTCGQTSAPRQNIRALLATAFYAVLLSSYEWLITGGGLTRSPAQMYFLLALALFLMYLNTGRPRWFWLSALCAALMTGHHLEYAWLLAFSLPLFTLGRRTSGSALKTLGGYALVVIAFTSPYWGTVLRYHGVSPFQAGLAAGDFHPNEMIGRLITLVFTREYLSNFIDILAVLGIVFALTEKKDRRNVLWLLLICVLDNRSAFRTLVFPIAILAAGGVDHLCAYIDRLRPQSAPQGKRTPAHWFLLFTVAYPCFLAYLQTLAPAQVLTGLTSSERAAMVWAQANTPADSQFVVLDDADAWFDDRQAEWFPTLAERISLNTVQGQEWFPGKVYAQARANDASLRTCLADGGACLEYFRPEPGKPLYVYLSASLCGYGDSDCALRLKNFLGDTYTFTWVYRNPDVAIAVLEENSNPHLALEQP